MEQLGKALKASVPAGPPPPIDQLWLLVKTELRRGHKGGNGKADVRQFLKIRQHYVVEIAGIKVIRSIDLMPLVSN